MPSCHSVGGSVEVAAVGMVAVALDARRESPGAAPAQLGIERGGESLSGDGGEALLQRARRRRELRPQGQRAALQERQGARASSSQVVDRAGEMQRQRPRPQPRSRVTAAHRAAPAPATARAPRPGTGAPCFPPARDRPRSPSTGPATDRHTAWQALQDPARSAMAASISARSLPRPDAGSRRLQHDDENADMLALEQLGGNSKGTGGHERKERRRERQPVVIKKYANRRLYNTATSSYVTLDDLAAMVKQGSEFVVYDAKTGEDITRAGADPDHRRGGAERAEPAADQLPAPAHRPLRRQHAMAGAALSRPRHERPSRAIRSRCARACRTPSAASSRSARSRRWASRTWRCSRRR